MLGEDGNSRISETPKSGTHDGGRALGVPDPGKLRAGGPACSASPSPGAAGIDWVVLVESGYIIRRNPDTVRGPDVSFVSRGRLDPDRIPAGLIPFAPDFAIEILSPEDHSGEIAEKVSDYLEGGTRLMWVVDPVARSVTIHRPDRSPETIGPPKTADGGDVVPGFVCRLDPL